jgi:hypothetical protein
MLPRRDQNHEDVLDVAAGAEVYWMRFFASLRMTAVAAPLLGRNRDVNVIALLVGP